VSPSGNDANSGTQSQPWATFKHAVSKLQAGDTLYAMGGTYSELVSVSVSGTAAAPITITAYPGQSPVIDGASLTVPNYATLLYISGNYVNASGFEVRNINNDGHGGHGGSAIIAGGYGIYLTGTHDTASNMLVHQTWAQGIFASGDYSTIQDSTIYQVAMSNCRLSGVANCSTVTRGWPSCVSAASNYGTGQITHNAIIQRNTVYNCWGEGISSWLSDGVVIQDNVTYDNWAQNLYVNNATNGLIQRNLIYNTPNNYVNARAAFSLADEVTAPPPANNPLSSHNTVVNNLIYNAQFCAYCWTLVSGSGLNNVLIANNTVVNPVGTASFATGTSNAQVNIVNVGSTIVNNIVVGNGQVPNAAGLSLSNNLWSVVPSTAALGPGDIVADPKLLASGSTGPGQLKSSYFQLQAGSLAIGAGKVLTQVPANFAGTPVSVTAPDIGAF
jgi:hypothetical protein